MQKPLSTADVPSHFLQSAFLVGHIPHRASTYDPRTSYSLYIPPESYNPNPAAGEHTHSPETTLPGLPLLVFIHGTGRNLSPMYEDLESFAQLTPCAVLAPLFPAGLEGQFDLDSYKIMRSKTLRSDLALLSMLDEVAQTWLGINTDKIFLMGFSGGGQFSLRFLYLYPERVAAVSIGAPGRVTRLDAQLSWPSGIADVQKLFERTIKKDVIRQVSIQLLIGGDDVDVHGGKEFWQWVQRMKGSCDAGKESAQDITGGTELPDMKKGRLDSIRELQELWKEDGIESQLDIVAGVAHNNNGVRFSALQFLQPFMRKIDK
ncbi:alpha/beta-hydrolase [Thozetella sp. PMI_491]|nr:alpha/beta-hydrolase [Thozetella sp. PMI_491]